MEALLWSGHPRTDNDWQDNTERGHLSKHVWPRDPGPEGREWTAKRLRKVVWRELENGLRQRVGVQGYRHPAMAMGRRYLDGREMFRLRDTDREGDREDPDVQASETVDLQASHYTDVAQRVYARDVGEQRGVVGSHRKQFR
jgi:hypothetical protein